VRHDGATQSPKNPAPMEDFLKFAEELADAARPIAMRHFRHPLAIETKADASPVTIADRLIEAELRRMIAARFPDHAIFGEEFANSPALESPGTSDRPRYTWVLDPIDGTRSFISGMPLFGTLIALLRDGRPQLGVVDFPALGERWMAADGAATRHNGVPARTSTCVRIEQARVYATSPDIFDGLDWPLFDALSRRAAMRRYGGDCYAYALLASGHCDLVVEAGLQPYDYLPLVAVIEGAGGRISDWQGQALGLDSDGHVVAAATAALWQQTLAELRH